MMTRSIVGRFLIVAVLLVSLGVIAQAALIISRQADKAAVAKAGPVLAAPSSAMAASTVPAVPAAGASAETADASPVRVVYPGPLGDAPPPPRKIADAAPTSPLPVAAPVAAAPAVPAQADPAVPAEPATPAPATTSAQAPAPVQAGTPVNPAPVVMASADAGTQPTADPAAPAKGGVNLNTASVDALNRVGGGHIGQTIVKHRPYRSVEDLVKKRVVRRSVYEQIKDQVAAD